MKQFFTGKADKKPGVPIALPVSNRKQQTDPAGYVTDPGLVDAVNIALTLGQPLLLTGEPGIGKTQLASRIAWELGYGDPLLFETKSDSTAQDLFYTFDSLRRFHAAHTHAESQDNRDYIEYNALGSAILYANEPCNVKGLIRETTMHVGKRRSVVLIDEVDKAPRDFPNDLLSEIDQMYFRIPELGNVCVSAPADMRPVVVIASNSEKNLPDPFLRRCIYYHIPFPSVERLEEIITRRLDLGSDEKQPMLKDALTFFLRLRELNLRKNPSSAELINWVDILIRGGADRTKALKSYEGLVRSTLMVLAKNADDLAEATRFASVFFGAN